MPYNSHYPLMRSKKRVLTGTLLAKLCSILSFTHRETHIHTRTYSCRAVEALNRLLVNNKVIIVHTNTHAHTHTHMQGTSTSSGSSGGGGKCPLRKILGPVAPFVMNAKDGLQVCVCLYMCVQLSACACVCVLVRVCVRVCVLMSSNTSKSLGGDPSQKILHEKPLSHIPYIIISGMYFITYRCIVSMHMQATCTYFACTHVACTCSARLKTYLTFDRCLRSTFSVPTALNCQKR